MMLLLFAVQHAAFPALLVLSAYSLGAALTSRVQVQSSSEKFGLATTLGLGTIGMLVFVLGLCGWLDRTAVGIGFVTIHLVCAPVLLSAARVTALRAVGPGFWSAVSCALVLLALVAAGLLALYPSTEWDATMYHLACARDYARAHEIAPTPDLRFAVFPQLNEMLFALMLVVGGDIDAQMAQFCMMIVAAVLLFGWGRRIGSSRIGWWAAGAWLSSPLVFWLGGSGYIDVGLALFCTAGLFSFWNWVDTRSASWLGLVGVFLGFAAGSKYSALFLVGAVWLAVAVSSWKRREALPLGVYTCAAALVSLPWYIRNLVTTGDPFFPFFGHVFGFSYWSAPDLVQILVEMSSYGQGRSLGALLEVPWNFLFDRSLYMGHVPFSPCFSLGIPLMLLAAARLVRVRQMLLMAVSFAIFWFLTLQQIRYLLPVIPLIGLVIATSVWWLLESTALAEKRRAGGLTTALGLAVLLAPSVRYAVKTLQWEGPIPITDAQQTSYLAARLGDGYGAYRFLNASHGPNYAVYGLYQENMPYFADGRSIGDWVGRARYREVESRLSKEQNPALTLLAAAQRMLLFELPVVAPFLRPRDRVGELYRFLRSLGADHFLFDGARGNRVIHLPDEAELLRHFKPVYGAGEVRVFELVSRPVVRKVSAELLQNPGFEETGSTGPAAWTHVGNPVIDGSATLSHGGSTAVQGIGDANVLVQSVPVQPLETYRLSHHARSIRPDQEARLQVNWTDGSGRLLGVGFKLVHPSAEWQRFEMVTTAPAGAAFAHVHASPHGGSAVWFDDFSLVRVWYEESR